MAHLVIANLNQLEYAGLKNGLASQYSMKKNQYTKDLTLSEDMMKNHCHDDSGTRKTENKTSKHEIF